MILILDQHQQVVLSVLLDQYQDLPITPKALYKLVTGKWLPFCQNCSVVYLRKVKTWYLKLYDIQCMIWLDTLTYPRQQRTELLPFLKDLTFHIVNRIVKRQYTVEKIDMENPYINRKTIYCGNYMKY